VQLDMSAALPELELPGLALHFMYKLSPSSALEVQFQAPLAVPKSIAEAHAASRW
jgi:hypothetical protein